MASQAEFARAQRTVHTNPAEVIRKAQSPNDIVHLKTIINNVQAVPALQTPAVFKILLDNLSTRLVPDSDKPAAPRSPDTTNAERAMLSLMAIGNFDRFLQTGPGKPYLDLAKAAWPGMWLWLQWFKLINARPGMEERYGIERAKFQNQIMSFALYALTHDDDLQTTITNTPGVVEFLAENWREEDYPETGKALVLIPVASAALHHVLFLADDAMLDRVVNSTFPGSPDRVADLCIQRIRQAAKKPAATLSVQIIQSYIDVTVSFCRCPNHPLRMALLQKGIIGWATKALVAISTRSLRDPDVLSAVIACLGCIANLIECTDGIPWVRQTVREGFLTGFVNIMPEFHLLDSEAQKFTISLIENVLPRYLVYRSVIQTVTAAMEELDTADVRAKVAKSPVKSSWNNVRKLAESRSATKEWIDENKGQMSYCDHCGKQGTKANFKRCAGCKCTLYCSKECQVSGWKKQHKNECALKDQERLSFQSNAIVKQDRTFLHALTINQARIMLSRLKQMARDRYPDTPLDLIGIRIDYTCVPPVPSVFQLVGHDMTDRDELSESELACLTPAEREAHKTAILSLKAGTGMERSYGILKRAIESDGKMTLVESLVSQGASPTMIVTLSARRLWDDPDVPADQLDGRRVDFGEALAALSQMISTANLGHDVAENL